MAKRVCVTGATGFIARHLIYSLLEQGYYVVGTVRSKSNTSKMGYLQYLQSIYKDRFEIKEADVMDKKSLEDVVQGCEGVFHLASPYKFLGPNATAEEAKELIEPGITGTRNVLTVCAEHKDTVKKIVYMSSIFAMVNSFSPDTPPGKHMIASISTKSCQC
jgi:nucleoside-diphosphate-sugar epimerase